VSAALRCFPPFLACACTCMVAVDKTCGMVQEHARRSPAAAGAAPRRPRPSDPADVFVLDFDGVIVNSEPEVQTCSYHQPRPMPLSEEGQHSCDYAVYVVLPVSPGSSAGLHQQRSSARLCSARGHFSASLPLFGRRRGGRRTRGASWRAHLGRLRAQVSQSGFQAAARYWPRAFRGVGTETRLRVLADMARARPVLVRGAEAMVMVRAGL